ncbi:MAG: ABC transporter substrate-binding protein [Dehalococcoidia bacterium]|nr:ABC transporter substrate-binding protein [Dehalococcoidia bacterium]
MRKDSLPPRHGPGWPLLVILTAGIGIIAAALFAVRGSFTGSDGEQSVPYVEAVVGAPARINPLFAYLSDADRDLSSLVFSGLARLDADGRVLPDLAQSWDISADGKTITFHLRPGVTWHTGVAFTADDVIFTYQLLADPRLQGDPEQAALWQALACSAPEQLTVQCTLPDAFAPFLSFATIGIVPKHILQNVDPAAILDDAFNKAPIGTGPYRLAQFDQTRAVLKANQNYYGAPTLLPEIQLRFYPNVSSAAADVVRGQAHGILVDLGTSQKDFETLSSTDGLRAYAAGRSAYTALYLNNSTAPLNDESVREAVAYSVDTEAIIGDILGGRAVRAGSPIPPGTWAYNTGLKPYPHDPGKARDVLDRAGWALPDGAKVRQRNGVELRLTLMTDQDTLRGAIADEVSRELAGVGIQATVVRQAATSLIKDFLIPREYQAAIFAWDPGPDPDPYPAWHSSQASGNGRNLAAYRNEEADKLMEEARRTSDLDERQRLYFTFQQTFQDDFPSVLLYYPVYTYFVSDQVKNIRLGTLFTTASRFQNVTEWTIEKAPDIRGG